MLLEQKGMFVFPLCGSCFSHCGRRRGHAGCTTSLLPTQRLTRIFKPVSRGGREGVCFLFLWQSCQGSLFLWRGLLGEQQREGMALSVAVLQDPKQHTTRCVSTLQPDSGDTGAAAQFLFARALSIHRNTLSKEEQPLPGVR